MKEINRILVVSRLSAYCRKTIHCGVSLSQKYNAELNILQVMYNPFEHMNMPTILLDEEYKMDRERVKKELDEIIENERKKGIKIKEIIKEGEPTEQIIKVIEEEKIDFVVLHAYKDSFWDHFVAGYRSDEIVRKIPCSVLLLKESTK